MTGMEGTTDNRLLKSEFADRQGWSRAYVSKLNKAGRLVLSDDGRYVLVSETLETLRKTASPEKQGVRERWARHRGDERPGPDPQDGADYQMARAKRERHMANLAELDEARKRGELLDRAATERAVTDTASMTRQALQRLPDRVGSQLAAEPDPEKVYAMLETEIEQICDDLYANIVAAAEAAESRRQ